MNTLSFHKLFAFVCFATGLGIKVAIKPEFHISPLVCFEFNIPITIALFMHVDCPSCVQQGYVVKCLLLFSNLLCK